MRGRWARRVAGIGLLLPLLATMAPVALPIVAVADPLPVPAATQPYPSDVLALPGVPALPDDLPPVVVPSEPGGGAYVPTTYRPGGPLGTQPYTPSATQPYVPPVRMTPPPTGAPLPLPGNPLPDPLPLPGGSPLPGEEPPPDPGLTPDAPGPGDLPSPGEGHGQGPTTDPDPSTDPGDHPDPDPPTGPDPSTNPDPGPGTTPGGTAGCDPAAGPPVGPVAPGTVPGTAAMPAVTVDGPCVLRGGQPWWFAGYNSFVWSGDCGDAGERMSATDVDRWFASMRRDGHGAVRLFFLEGWDLSRLDAAVASAQRYGVYLTITLDDAIGGCGETDKTAAWFADAGETAAYERHMRMLLERYRGWTAIAWFEFFNEPDSEGGALRRFYDRMGAVADRIDPDRLFSSGTVAPYWVGGEAAFRSIHESPGVDIASLHEYDETEVESHHGPRVRANAAGKPVVVGEFGITASADGAGCTTFAERARRTTAKLGAYTGQGYAGAFGWAWQPGRSGCELGNLDVDTATQRVFREFTDAGSTPLAPLPPPGALPDAPSPDAPPPGAALPGAALPGAALPGAPPPATPSPVAPTLPSPITPTSTPAPAVPTTSAPAPPPAPAPAPAPAPPASTPAPAPPTTTPPPTPSLPITAPAPPETTAPSGP